MTRLFSIFLLCLPAFAQTVPLAWDASTSAATNSISYFLYAHTNALNEVNRTNPAVKLFVGTNLTAKVESLASGHWWFGATAADTNGIESLLSNIVHVEVPQPPANMRAVFVQYSMTLTNFVDVGYFRLRLP